VAEWQSEPAYLLDAKQDTRNFVRLVRVADWEVNVQVA